MRELNKGSKPYLISLEQICNEIKEHLQGKKYLLVLDDVWTDHYDNWLEFEEILKVGQRRSRIVVTTRSKKVARNLGGQIYELKGLADEESWRLFERMSFTPDQIKSHDDDLVMLGKKIVKKCKNVPLAVKLVGSLLRYQSMPMWELFENRGISMLNENDDTMNQILKLSYHQLVSPLKSCFAYSAIFPKNFEIDKRMLINLWMAQGYVNVDYEGEEYIRTLLQRCFFQDIVEDKWGEVDRFKIHDLLHDVAEEVAGEE
ncbi:putative disease resistance protein RGA4 [Silene latifolia]|uniref:putative disease resistance protein RGA4 n=1 Tax=Silene latifolia TaxID=37657 RepID=UPI003D78B2E8